MADNTLRLAEAERERRKRMAQRDVASAGQTPSQAQATIGQNVNEFIGGVARPLAGLADMVMSPVAVARQVATGRPSPPGFSGVVTQAGDFSGNPNNVSAAAGEYVGMALPAAFGAAALGTTLPKAGKVGYVQTFLDNIAKTATKSPAAYFGSEALSAGGAGMLGQAAENQGAGIKGQLAAEVVGGAAGMLPAALRSGFRSAREGLTASLAPMTTEGGMIRAARQTQQRAGGQESAVAAAQSLENIPGGVTPAQWIGDERLMAQEARLLADNPELENIVRADLQEARIAAQDSLLDSFGKPRSRQDWERSVLEKVTPEGVAIEPGMTDEMLESAYNSFKPLYDSVRGSQIDLNGYNSRFPDRYDPLSLTYQRGEVDISPVLEKAVFSAEIDSSPAARNEVSSWVKNVSREYSRKIKDGAIDSGAIIDLRSKIRDQRRSMVRAGNVEKADLYGAAESSLTSMLYDSMPEESLKVIRAADSQYRKYKVVENAIFSAGDRALTPDQLSESIRLGGLTTTSQYARGANESVQELRSLALAGRSTDELLGDPRRAVLFVRGLDEEGKKAVQADFVNVLYNRAKERSVDATDSGVALISGEKLMRDIAENKSVLAGLGMPTGEVGRLETIARELMKLEKRSPQSVERLFEDGPASVIELVFTLFGAKSGQRLAGNGLGSSMVLAQYMSNKARKTLAGLTADEATRLMNDAVRDPKLYSAILTKDIVDPKKNREVAQYLEGWILSSAADKALSEDE